MCVIQPEPVNAHIQPVHRRLDKVLAYAAVIAIELGHALEIPETRVFIGPGREAEPVLGGAERVGLCVLERRVHVGAVVGDEV